MIVDVKANCRICGKVIAVKTGPTQADMDPNFPRSVAGWLQKMINEMAEKWKGSLTCNRCYDFRQDFRKAEEMISAICNSIFLNTKKIEDARPELEHAAHKICGIIETHYFIDGLYHDDFLQMLLDEPRNSGLYIRGLHAKARQINRDTKTKLNI